MKRLVFGCAILAAALGEAQTMTLWRGETAAAIVGDNHALGDVPAPLSIRFGELRPVRYAPEPGSLQRIETLDRVTWDTTGAIPRDGTTGGANRVIEVSAPPDAKPGVYKCGDVEITVIDRVLPPAKDWKYVLDLWQHPWAVARIAGVQPFSRAHYDAMRPVYELLASAGQKAITVPIVDLPWGHQCCDAYHSLVEDEKLRILSADREFAPKLAELRRIFRVSEAVEGRCDFRKIREDVLKAVN